MKFKNLYIAIFATIIICNGCKNKADNLTGLQQIRAYQNDLRFDTLTDLRFRLRSEKCSADDLRNYFDTLFEAFLSDRDHFDRLKKFSIDMTNYEKSLPQIVDMNDPFDLHRFGKISIKTSDNFMAFYSEISDGSEIRLRIIPLFDSLHGSKSYEELVRDFQENTDDLILKEE